MVEGLELLNTKMDGNLSTFLQLVISSEDLNITTLFSALESKDSGALLAPDNTAFEELLLNEFNNASSVSELGPAEISRIFTFLLPFHVLEGESQELEDGLRETLLRFALLAGRLCEHTPL
jgi:hypothetical protein